MHIALASVRVKPFLSTAGPDFPAIASRASITGPIREAAHEPGDAMSRIPPLLCAVVVLFGLALQASAEPLTLQAQGSFFIGGRDVTSDTLSTLPAYAPSGTITVDQMYVRYEVPVAAARHYPLTLIHGCCLTGKTWETTPDGRMGWDEFFVRKGYPVYVVDQSWRGRSAGSVAAINAVKSGKSPPDQLPTAFSAGHEAAWAIFRFGPEYPKIYLITHHTQPLQASRKSREINDLELPRKVPPSTLIRLPGQMSR